MTPTSPILSRVRRLGADIRGASAIEFALFLPVMLTLYLGGYQTTQALSAYRKVTLTTRTLADLTTQYTTMATADMTTVLGASTQVMAPFSTSALTIVLTEYSVSLAGVATVTWSKAQNGTALAAGSIVTLPVNICLPGASIVLATVSYKFTPVIGYQLTGPFIMSNHIFMAPRQVQSIPYTGT